MKLLGSLSWVPDKLMVPIQYYLQKGKIVNLKKPKTFNEKIQAYKLFYRDPLLLQCTDKEAVRDYVKRKGMEHLLVPLLGVYSKPEDIDFNGLPDKFVIKTSDGGGANEVIVCRKKEKKILEEIKGKVKEWINFPKPKKHIAREWAYDNGYDRKILIEELLEDPEGKKDIDDFKFYCFQGKYKFMQWHKDRHSFHRAGHLDENFKFLPEVEVDSYPTFAEEPLLPSNIEEMKIYAEKLAEDFPFVRVDMYNIGGKIYFGELTFYPASGYFNYKPEYVDEWLGSFFHYPFQKVSEIK